MRGEKDLDLWIILSLSGILILFVLFIPENHLQFILGLPFVLFFPGYALVSLLWPRKGELGTLERVVLSIGLSIGIVIILGLAVAVPGSVGLTPLTALLLPLVFIIVCSLVAIWRRRKVPTEERFFVSFKIELPKLESKEDKIFFGLVVIVLVIGAGMLTYLILTPKPGEEFTEFYVLDEDGGGENYPSNLSLGENATVIIGVVCHEGESTNYRVEIKLSNKSGERANKTLENYTLTLSHGARNEKVLTFHVSESGEYKLKFLLYKEEEAKPQELHLWIEVHPRGAW